jgi:oligopeptide transport system substrate-binding protein
LSYIWSAPPPPPGRRRPLAVVCGAALIVVIAFAAGISLHRPAPLFAPDTSVTIFGPSAESLDPAVEADAGSAQVVAQVYESLTAIDAAGNIQAALADGWQMSSGGRRVVFHLRPGLEFSDGSPLTSADVVRSWLRILNPAHPNQLASLLDDVVGARAYREGSGSKSAVGLSSSGADQVVVDLANPRSDFAAIVSGPNLAVVPAGIDSDSAALLPAGFVGSGAYVLSDLTDAETTLTANPHYWAGPAAITTVHLLTSIGGKSPVDEYEAGHLDYTPISVYDASWIASDSTLGPDLRIEPSPSVEFYGFDTSKPPFDNVHVRRAFQMGIDWRRLVELLGNPLVEPATGMVPPGVPGHSSTDFGPVFDLAKARAELTAAGYAGGAGFPKVTLITTGAGLDESVVRQLRDNLGIDIGYEALDGATYNDRLLTDPPAFWQMGWVADYPGADDFLGLLLGSGQTNNWGRWNSTAFDSAVSDALAGATPEAVQAGFDRAEGMVLDQAPVIPVDYGAGYSLARHGLLGALPNGEGLVRYAGLAWASGS